MEPEQRQKWKQTYGKYSVSTSQLDFMSPQLHCDPRRQKYTLISLTYNKYSVIISQYNSISSQLILTHDGNYIQTSMTHNKYLAIISFRLHLSLVAFFQHERYNIYKYPSLHLIGTVPFSVPEMMAKLCHLKTLRNKALHITTVDQFSSQASFGQ